MGSSDTSQITIDSDEIVNAGTGTSSFLDYVEFETRHTEWTNEKHCLYLKSMEASFINELYCSMGLYRGGEQKKEVVEKDLFPQQRTSFRDRAWRSICVNECGGKSEACASALMRNKRIRHFRDIGNHVAVEGVNYEDIDHDADRETELKTKAIVLSDTKSRQSTTILPRQDSVDNNIEMSDQNFAYNNESMKSSRVRRLKRSRKTEDADSDQVVPEDLTVTSDCKRMAPNNRC